MSEHSPGLDKVGDEADVLLGFGNGCDGILSGLVDPVELFLRCGAVSIMIHGDREFPTGNLPW